MTRWISDSWDRVPWGASWITDKEI